MTYLLACLLMLNASAAESKPKPLKGEELAERVALWQDLAEWYISNQLEEQALEMVSRLREAGEHTPELDLIQARAMAAQGMPDEARAILEELVRKTPRDARPWNVLGVVYSDLGEYDLAVTTIQRAIELEPENAASQNNLGFLLFGLGRCDEATPVLERATQIDPTNGRYRNNLAFSLVCSGDAQRALKLFRSTGTEAEARYNLGLAYERLEKYPSAILQYQESIKASPDYAEAKAALERLAPLGLLPDGAAPPAETNIPTQGAQP